MGFWKKIIVGICAVFLVMVGVVSVCFYFFSSFQDIWEMCGNTVLTQYPSPNRKLKAVVFERSCGATTGFSTQVSILQTGSVLENAGANLFVADTDHGRAPSGFGGGPEVRFLWISDSSAELQYHPLARTYLALPEVEGVQVSFLVAPPPPNLQSTP